MAEGRLDREIIQHYFHQAHENGVILEFLHSYHNISISLCTLKRRLRDYGLRRVRNEVDKERAKEIIMHEINNLGGSQGYRAIWHTLRLEHHMHVPRHLVTQIVKEVDSEGVQLRRRRRFSRRRYFSYGPSFCWHVDGK